MDADSQSPQSLAGHINPTTSTIKGGTGKGKPRVSQRQPQACQECTIRKVKCDKKIPCSRCARLNRHCARELVFTSKAVARGAERGDEVRFLLWLMDMLAIPDGLKLIREAITHRVDAIDVLGIRNEFSNVENLEQPVAETPPEAPVQGDFKPDFRVEGTPPSSADQATARLASSFDNTTGMMELEGQIWSRPSSYCFPHRRGCQCQQIRDYAEVASINSDINSPAVIWSFASTNIGVFPSIADAQKLVNFHISSLWWNHHVAHAPTFWQQCEAFWTSGMVVHPLWTAFYLSVITASVWTLLNAPKEAEKLGLVLDESAVERQYREMVRILYQENFLEHPSMFSIQAIMVSQRFAHSIGQTTLAKSLLSTAIGIAQSMDLHRIREPEAFDPRHGALAPELVWFETVEREVGKRTWAQLLIQDYLGYPYKEIYTVNLRQFSTAPPMNCNDVDMINKPDDQFTETWYIRQMLRFSTIAPPWLDRLGSMRTRKSHADLVKQIALATELLQAVQAKFPVDMLRTSKPGERPYPWKPIAYRTTMIAGADKRVYINRPLLPHVFQTDKFLDNRKTCVAAATLAATEFIKIWDEDGEGIAIWTTVAATICAVVILGRELLYRDSHSDEQANLLRKLLSSVAEIFRRRRADVPAAKAARLIDLFIASEENVVLRAMRGQGDAKGVGDAEGIMQEERLLFQLFSLTNREATSDASSPNQDISQPPHPTVPTPAPAQDPMATFDFDLLTQDPVQLCEWFTKAFSEDMS